MNVDCSRFDRGSKLYLAVAQAYIANGGPGAAVQVTRIQALNAALGNK